LRGNNIDQFLSANNTRFGRTAVSPAIPPASRASPDDNTTVCDRPALLTSVISSTAAWFRAGEIDWLRHDLAAPTAMIDKVFYRSGDGVILTPLEYSAQD
jgi:hypothetical protein